MRHFKRFKESDLNETILKLEELGQTASSITEAVNRRTRTFKKQQRNFHRWNPSSLK